MIVKNAIRCNICGDEIESKHRHNYVVCKCGACAVDGGHDYLRRVYSEEGCFTELSVVVKEDDGRKVPQSEGRFAIKRNGAKKSYKEINRTN